MNVDECDGRDGVPAGFLELSRQVYRDDPRWIPESAAAVAAAFSAANTWFAAGKARVFCVPGKVRAAAFFEPQQRIRGEPVAFFGYFESVGDPAADRALMDAVEAWSSERGAQTLYGPINFNTTTGYRLRLDVDDGLPFLGEPYNPPYYPAALEALGFAIHQGYSSQLIPCDIARRVTDAAKPALEALLAAGYRFEQPTAQSWADNLPTLHKMVDAIFGENFAYTPLTYDSFAQFMGPTLLRKICPRTSVMAFAPSGEAVGFALIYPHWGPLIVQGRSDGPPIAPGDLDYAAHEPLLRGQKPRIMISKTFGVAPAYRQKRLFSVLALQAFERSIGIYDFHYATLIRDDNPSRRMFESAGVPERRYGLYAKSLTPAAVAAAQP